MQNEFGYQGDFSEEEEETGYGEFMLRMYDPTTARWLGVDPYDQFSSPYLAMGNDPVNNVDPDGGFVGTAFNMTSSVILNKAIDFTFGAIVGGIVGASNGGSEKSTINGALIGGVAGLASGFLVGVDWGALGSFFSNNIGKLASFGTANLLVTNAANAVYLKSYDGSGFEGGEAEPDRYLSEDAAAIGWARRYTLPTVDNGSEMSSLIYSFVEEGKTYYSFTKAKYHSKELRRYSSPPPSELVDLLPSGAKKTSHIHSHTSSTGSIHPDTEFSPDAIGRDGDETMMRNNKDLSFYLTTPDGFLKVRRVDGSVSIPLVEGLPRFAKYGGDYAPGVRYKLKIRWGNVKGIKNKADLEPVSKKVRLDERHYK